MKRDIAITDKDAVVRLVDQARRQEPYPQVLLLIWFGLSTDFELRDLLRLRVREVREGRLVHWSEGRWRGGRSDDAEWRKRLRELLHGRKLNEFVFGPEGYNGADWSADEKTANAWIMRACERAGIDNNVRGFDTLIMTREYWQEYAAMKAATRMNLGGDEEDQQMYCEDEGGTIEL